MDLIRDDIKKEILAEDRRRYWETLNLPKDVPVQSNGETSQEFIARTKLYWGLE